MAAGQRDRTGCALWWGLGAGFLLTAAGYGDERHLRSLLFAGVILTCGALVTLVIRWGFSGQVPGSVTLITDAPSALELAAANAEEIRVLKLRVSGIFLLMGERAADPAQQDAHRAAKRDAVIIQFPAGTARNRGGSQAGLCAAV